MPRSSKPSRRRLVAVAEGSSGGNHPPDASDVTGIEMQISNGNGRYNNTNTNDENDDDGKNRKPRCRRPWYNPFVSMLFSSRTTFAIIMALAMMGVAVGIIVGTFTVFSPPKPKPRFVTIERSNYKYTPRGNNNGNSDDNNNNLVLGKRPRPPDSEEPRSYYHPSQLESYVIENGRTDPKLGYDRQVVQYRDDDDGTLTKKERASLASQSSDLVMMVSLFGYIRKRISDNNNVPLTYVDYSDLVNTQDMPSGCELWVNPEVTTPLIYGKLQTYRTELEDYELYLSDWTWTWEPPKSTNKDSLLWAAWIWNSGASAKTETSSSDASGDDDDDATARKEDLRDYMDETTGNKDVCESLEVHPEGLQGIFNRLWSLSLLPSTNNNNNDDDISSKGAFVLEPFLPPLRHPEFCYTDYSLQKLREHETKNGKAKTKTNEQTEQLENENNRAVMDTGYIVHDFAAMCRNNLHKHSKTVFVDVGASFDFRYGNKESSKEPPRHDDNKTVALLRLYQRFGFVFDHIYGYKVTTTTPQQDPSDVFWEIPDEFKASYHWFNVGVDTDPKSYANPFKLISETFKPDDFVVVKLEFGIDTNANANTPGEMETALAHQLLLMEEFERTSKPPFQHKLSDLIDVIYFEHHFTMKEMAIPWNDSMRGSMQDSMEFFTSLREHGIAAHYWI